MTRSTAKRYRYCKTCKGQKRQANKHIRRILKNLDRFIGNADYRRLYPSYLINDGGRPVPILPTDNEDVKKLRRK